MVITVIRSLAALVLAFLAPTSAQTLDDALAALCRRVAARVPPGERVEFTHRNLSALSTADAQRIRGLFERAVQRRAPRGAPATGVSLTLSENNAGFLLVAEVKRAGEYRVETEPFQVAPPGARPRLTLVKRLLWQQETPILDVLELGGKMYVLSPAELTELTNNGGRWQISGSAPVSAPPVRDPRGRLITGDDQLAAFLPGRTCRASLSPTLAIQCEDASAPFLLVGTSVRWTPSRNTLEAEGWPPLFSVSEAADHFLVTSADGRSLLFDRNRRLSGPADGWEASDHAVIDSACAPGHILALKGAGSLQAFSLSQRQLEEAGEPEPVAGDLTALWPSAGGALAVLRDPSTTRYAAYHVSIACRP